MRGIERSCAAWLLRCAALLLPRTAPLSPTHACAKKGGDERQGGEELAGVLTGKFIAAVWLYTAQRAAVVLEKEVCVDGGAVRRSVGELRLRVLV